MSFDDLDLMMMCHFENTYRFCIEHWHDSGHRGAGPNSTAVVLCLSLCDFVAMIYGGNCGRLRFA